MNILALDIDDCIFPNNNTWIGQTNDNLDILAINLTRIKMMIEKYDLKVFITSSWTSILKLSENNLIYNNKNFYTGKSYYIEEKKAFDMLSKVLNGYVIGLSNGDRFEDINLLLEQNYKVLALDDSDLSSIIHDNFKFCQTIGLITNFHTNIINKFFSNIINN